MKKLIIFILLMSVMLFSIIVGSFFYMGKFLSPQDKLEKSDVIIVVSGGETLERTLEGIDLYKQGYAKYLLFSGAARSGNISNAKTMRLYALKNNVSKNNILIEEESRTTYENALLVKKIIAEKKFRKIILVTSPYHQKRAALNFSHVLGKDYQIINHSSGDSNWESSNWWKNKKSINTTFDEFTRVMYLLFTKDYDYNNEK